MRILIIALFLALPTTVLIAQSLGVVKGAVSDRFDSNPIPGVHVKLIGTSLQQLTDAQGNFEFQNIPLGNQLLELSMEGYATQNFPLTILEGKTIDLGTVFMHELVLDQNNLSVISLSEVELNADQGVADNTAGLLQASRDVFLNTAAFDFSQTFFRARGYNSEHGKVLINGVEMNKLYNGRPQWSNWGGLNDLMRNQELSNGLAASEYTFGGIAGANNLIMRASTYRKGGRVSIASSNRSYAGRFMASYASGLSKNGWAYALLFSRRYANEGYVAGTLYDANSFFIAIEKVFNQQHSLNITAFYTPNRRGKSSANTQEVIDLKDTRYNSYWGKQDATLRNSRIKKVQEPVLMLNHYWTLNESTSIQTNMAFQLGRIGNSRLDFGGTTLLSDTSGNDFIIGGGSNPDPTYYQKLPSYYLRDTSNPDYEGAYLAEQEFRDDGQIDWESMYAANINAANLDRNAIYALYEDRNDDQQITLNSIINSELNAHTLINGAISYRKMKSKNFAHMLDVLGGTGYLDVDGFADTLEEAQNDLQNPNRIVQEGDTFKYNYEIDAQVIDAFAQAQFTYNKIDFYASGQVSSSSYQRNGLYENGRFPGTDSFGPSEKLSFTNFGAKAGATYKISGRHIVDFNAGYRTKAPSIRNSFSNARENNDVVLNLTDEKISTIDASYIIRTPIIQGRITGFYTTFQDATEISFFYAEGLNFTNDQGTIESNAFVQEVMTGIDKKNIGLELGLTAQLSSTIKLKAVAAIGDYTYDNNPNLYVTSSDIQEYIDDDGTIVNEGDRLDLGTTYLESYHIAGGPQRALSIGFEYRDPAFWWIGITGNQFSNGYVDIAPIKRTSSFTTDSDGTMFNDYDEDIARELLAQEKFNSYYLVNLTGGKSWKIDDYYVGFFAAINNILNERFTTGGYEQSRSTNYRVLKEDMDRETPVFGNKYWSGYGASYYLNLYFRF